MNGKTTSPPRGQEADAENDNQRFQYADGGHALASPSTRRAVATGAAATSTSERLHEHLTVATEAGARLDEEYEPEVRLSVERDDIEETLSFTVELDASEARELARSLEESAREAEEIVVEERVSSMEADR